MKTALALALVFGALAFADDRDRTTPPNQQDEQQQQDPGSNAKRRLDSVTWNLKTHKLIWVVQSGSVVDGKFVPAKSEQYEISPDDAIMAVEQEKRGFTTDEAKSLHNLLDMLSLYCAESVVWWDEGEGVPLDPSGVPLNPQNRQDDSPKPKKVEQRRDTPPRQPNVALIRVVQ